jgi:hypothetical protein
LRSISSVFAGIFVSIGCVGLSAALAANPSGGDAGPAPTEPLPVELLPAAPIPVEARVEVETAWIVSDATGARRLSTVPPPGEDEAERLYTGRFRHVGGTPAEALRITLRVPPGLRYVPGSATGPGAVVEYSADGAQSFAAADELQVATDSHGGETESRSAGPEDYTHVRWRLLGRFPPGTTGLVSFRVLPRAAGGEEVESP